MAVFLRPQGAGNVLGAVHDLPALVIEAENGRHAVSAGRSFQCGRTLLGVTDASCRGSRSRAESCHKSLLLHPWLYAQRGGNTMHVPHLVPLIRRKCQPFCWFFRLCVKPLISLIDMV